MRLCTPIFGGALLVLLTGLVAHGEVKVAVERNDQAGAAQGVEFKFTFKNVRAPVSNDAASGATFTLVDGLRDENGGPLRVLQDGKLPNTEDQPNRNFFFGQGQNGGRLVIDLGKVIDIGQVDTYSWHAGTRGPQVYKLFAADGAAPGFAAQPKNGTDPAGCGWTHVADVDTRPKSGTGGGQYGVSISDSARAIGKYRYLLFCISATEQDDRFGNTFYSEIDVLDAAGPPMLDAATAASAVRLTSTSPAAATHQITIDYTDAPELQDWVTNKLQPAVDKWYPLIVQGLPSEGYSAPSHVAIALTEDYQGVAATTGNHVVCSVDWFKKNLDGEAVGAVIHELVHVVQQYGQARSEKRNPGWLVEGVADYVRWFQYEPTPTGTRPADPKRAKYTDSYRTTAGFLQFVVDQHDKELIVKLNAAMRQGKYSADLWKEYTGKTVDELWEAYVATLTK